MTQGEITNERNEAAQDEMLASILQKLSSAPTVGADAAASGTQGEQSGSAQANPMGDIISSLLSNPEMLSRLPSLLSGIKPIMEMLGGMGGTQSAPASSISAPQSVPASPAVTHSKNADSRTALLCAMKPYLSRDRQNAIDYIVKLGRLGDILKTL